MIKAYKYRLYPNKAQQEVLTQHFNACRFVYNLSLDAKIRAWQSCRISLSQYDLIKQLPDLKQEAPWLSDVYSQCLQASIINMCDAFKRMSSGNGFPNYKSKRKSRKSYTIPQGVRVEWDNGLVKLPKAGLVKAVFDRRFEGTIKTAYVYQTCTDKYYISITVDNKLVVPEQPVDPDRAIGVDLGIIDLAILSDGTKVANPKHLTKSIARLRKLGRSVSRKKKFSGNWRRAVNELSRHHEKVANQRKDYLHKVSRKLVDENQTICFEKLQVDNMRRNRKLARSISDCGWVTLQKMVEAKCAAVGKRVLYCPTFAPTSKTCNQCGSKKELTLADRSWVCACGAEHDRDINAAINIRKIALTSYRSDSPVVEPRTLVRAMKQRLRRA